LPAFLLALAFAAYSLLATLPAEAATLSVSSLQPAGLVRGSWNVVTIQGTGFRADTWGQFRDSDGRDLKTELAYADEQTLRAAVMVPAATSGRLRLDLVDPSGSTSTMEDAAAVVEREFWVEVLVNGEPAQLEPASIDSVGGPFCPTDFKPSIHRTRPSVFRPASGCSALVQVTRQDQLTYIVHRSFDNAVVLNCNASITVSAWPNTGGHCHNDPSRPFGSPQTASGNTGPDGMQFKVLHTWPQVSGDLLVQLQPDAACTVNQSGISENLFVHVRGPDPESSTAGMSQLGLGTGYTLEKGPDNDSRHPDNHYGIPALLAALQNLALDWGAPANGRPLLGYNDMSLMWGGVFDVSGAGCARPPDWVSPCHCSHRNGNICDFQTTQLSLAMRKKVLPYVTKYFYRGIHGNHWHLTLKQ
jgi:hypothetical protein